MMHYMFFQLVATYWLEGTRPDVQGDTGRFDASQCKLLQAAFIKMQAGRWRSHRAGPAGVDRLVAFVVSRLVTAPDVGRQWHVPLAFQHAQGTALSRELQPEQVSRPSCHGSRDSRRKVKPRTGSGRFAGAHMCQHLLLAGDTFDQHLHPAAGLLVPQQAGWNDPGIIENHQVPGV